MKPLMHRLKIAATIGLASDSLAMIRKRFKPRFISSKGSHRVFGLGLLAVLTLVLAGVVHPLTTAFSITDPGSAMNQPSAAQELIAQAPATAPVQPSPAQSAPPVASTPASPVPIAPSNITTSDTALLFQNDRYAVRVFREGAQAYANVYDKAKQTHQTIPVSITPASDPKKDPTKYVATIGDQQYVITISPLGASDLTILQKGRVAYQQRSNQLEVARQVPGVSAQPQPVNPNQQLVKTLFVNYAKLTLFILMFSLGLLWTFEDVFWLWRHPSLLARSLFSVLIAVPLFGVLAALIPGLTGAQQIGIGAMVICPGAPMIPSKSLKVGGHPKFVGSLQFAVSILAIITVPLSALILAQFYPNEAWLSPQEIANQIFFAQILPMGLGVLIAQYLPKLADDLRVPAKKIASLLLLLVLIVLLGVTLDDVLTAGLPAYLAIGFLTVTSLVCGHFLGGSESGTRTALAYATVTRNAGLALLLVLLNFPNLDYVKGGIINMLITYAIVSAIVAIPYTAWRKKTLATNLEPANLEPVKSESA